MKPIIILTYYWIIFWHMISCFKRIYSFSHIFYKTCKVTNMSQFGENYNYKWQNLKVVWNIKWQLWKLIKLLNRTRVVFSKSKETEAPGYFLNFDVECATETTMRKWSGFVSVKTNSEQKCLLYQFQNVKSGNIIARTFKLENTGYYLVSFNKMWLCYCSARD